MIEQTIKCHICGKPYKFYAFSAADQSACPACVRAAEEAVSRPSNTEEIRRRQKYYGTN